MTVKTLVIAVDNTMDGLLAIEFALENFAKGYEYHLLHIRTSLSSFIVPPPFPHAAAMAHDQESRRTKDKATKHFLSDVFIPKASSGGASVVAANVQHAGTPDSANIGAAICQYVEEVAPAGVILMRKNMSMISRLCMGSVTKYCVEHCQAPVIVVPTGPSCP